MKTLLLALTFTSLAISTGFAQKDGNLSPAEKFLNLTRFEASGVEAAKTAFQPFLTQLKAQGIPAAAIKEIDAAAEIYFHQLMTDPGLKKDVLKLYNETFTEEEFAEMLAFYDTPVGRKTLVEMPKIMGEAMLLGEKYSTKYAPAFEEQVGKILEKHRDDGKDDGGDDKPAPEEKE